MRKFPRVLVDLNKLRENIRIIREECEKKGISITFVVKGCSGMIPVIDAAVDEGIESIASSRLEQFMALGKDWNRAQKVLLRIPAPSEVEEVVEWTDISLNSDMEVLKLLNQAAESKNTVHKVLLMMDLGDLREGFWTKEEIAEAAEAIEKSFKNLQLVGIGTNLGCYGSILATEEKMNQLAEIAEFIESIIGKKLDIVSGGGTTSLPRVICEDMNSRINNLRVGEGILLGKDLTDIFHCNFPGINRDAFIFQCEISEVRVKASHPIGEIGRDGFGFMQEYVDRGMRKRCILSAGKVDYGYPELLVPEDCGIEILGASSDHTIADIQFSEKEWKTGDVMSFQLSYANLVYLTGRSDISIIYKDK